MEHFGLKLALVGWLLLWVLWQPCLSSRGRSGVCHRLWSSAFGAWACHATELWSPIYHYNPTFSLLRLISLGARQQIWHLLESFLGLIRRRHCSLRHFWPESSLTDSICWIVAKNNRLLSTTASLKTLVKCLKFESPLEKSIGCCASFPLAR